MKNSKLKRTLGMGVALAQLVSCLPYSTLPVQAADDESGAYAPGQAIVCLQTGGNFASIQSAGTAGSLLDGAESLFSLSKEDSIRVMASADNDRWESPSATELKLVKSDSLSTEELIDALQDTPGVLFAEPNYQFQVEPVEDEVLLADGVTPDMTYYQFAYGNSVGGMDVPDWNDPENINAEGTVVAILDSGVDYTNEDLANVMWADGDQYESLKALGGGKYGYNAWYGAKDSRDPQDDNGHGTHCAGIVAAEWNGIGMSGAANGTKIMAVRNGDVEGLSYFSDSVKGFYYILTAKQAGVNVVAVNCSWGGPVSSQLIAYVVDALAEEGIVTLFASGNDDKNVDFASDTVSTLQKVHGELTINASGRSGKKTDFSNYGVRRTDLFAPGEDILSTVPIHKSTIVEDMAQPMKDTSDQDMADTFASPDTYFTYSVNEASKAEISVTDDGLKISGAVIPAAGEEDAMTLETIKEGEGGRVAALTVSAPAGIPEGKKGYLMVKAASQDNNLYPMVYVKQKDGSWVRPASTYNASEEGRYNIYPLQGTGKDGEEMATDLEQLCFRIVIYSDDYNGTAMTSPDLFLPHVIVTDNEVLPYDSYNGTSMATPAAAGAIAIVAAKWPEDSAEKRTSRLLASARRSTEFDQICMSGGMVNVRNALDESTYTPVISDVYLKEDGLHVLAYFAGTKDATVVDIEQNGTHYSNAAGSIELKNVTATEDGGTDILLAVPAGLTEGEICVTLSDTSKSAGKQDFVRYTELYDPEGYLKSDSPFYNTIPVSADIAISNYFWTSTAANGKLYFVGFDDGSGIYSTVTYDIASGVMERIDSGLRADSLCGWKGRIFFAESSTGRIGLFDPETQSVISRDYPRVNGEYLSDREVYSVVYSYGDGVLLFETPYTVDNLQKYHYGATEVYSVDPELLKAAYLGSTKGHFVNPVISHEVLEDGSVRIYLTGADRPEGEEKISCERFVLKDSFETEVLNVLPEGLRLDHEGMECATGCALKDGIFLTGVYTVKDENTTIPEIKDDNFFFSYAEPEKGFVPGERRVAPTHMYQSTAVAYDGKVYCLGLTGEEGSGMRFISFSDETLPDQGDEKAAVPDTSVKVKKLTFEKKKYALKELESGVVKATAVFADAEKTDSILYSSSNPFVARVNSLTGEVYADNQGTAEIIAACGDKTAKCTLQVSAGSYEPMLYSARMDENGNLTLAEGEQEQLHLDYLYISGKETVKYKSSNSKVATVKKGMITAKKAGEAEITVTAKLADGSSKEMKVKLTVTSVDLPKAAADDKAVKLKTAATVKIQAGKAESLDVILNGADYTKRVVKVRSTNENLLVAGEASEVKAGKKAKQGQSSFEFMGIDAGIAYLVVESFDPENPEVLNRRLIKVIISVPADEVIIVDLVDNTICEPTLVLKKGTVYYLGDYVSPLNCTDYAKRKWSAKGGAVKVKNGVVTAKSVSKKDKAGNYVPSTVTLTVGKTKATVNVIVMP
ncbi:MAG: S8 family serine peptidase [Lachnospiraceae bacterium]|nr:S8 family serine peptidase [Lachnospiraceae bacterium]